MPAAVIRARLRMGALCTHVRLWQSKTTDSPLCPQCRVEGDATHMLLLCPVFRLLRDKCQEQLNALYYPVELSVQLLLGSRRLLPTTARSTMRRHFYASSISNAWSSPRNTSAPCHPSTSSNPFALWFCPRCVTDCYGGNKGGALQVYGSWEWGIMPRD